MSETLPCVSDGHQLSSPGEERGPRVPPVLLGGRGRQAVAAHDGFVSLTF